MQGCHCPPPATPTPSRDVWSAGRLTRGFSNSNLGFIDICVFVFSTACRLPALPQPLPPVFPLLPPLLHACLPDPPPEPLATTRLTLQPLPLPPRPTGSLFPLHSLPFPLHSSHLFLPRGPVPSSPDSAIHVSLSTALHITTILFSNEDYYFFFLASLLRRIASFPPYFVWPASVWAVIDVRILVSRLRC